jgi:hypothetical protein
MNLCFKALRWLVLFIYVFSSDAATPSSKEEEVSLNAPYARLQLVDKVTGRFQMLNVKVGKAFQHQNLKIYVAVCRQSAEFDLPDSKAFITVWEYPKEELPKKLFSGWMIASSPALSTLTNHPRYNLWLVKCSGLTP